MIGELRLVRGRQRRDNDLEHILSEDQGIGCCGLFRPEIQVVSCHHAVVSGFNEVKIGESGQRGQ